MKADETKRKREIPEDLLLYAPASPVPVQRRTGYAADRASAEAADDQRRSEKPQGASGVGRRCPRLQCYPELQKS